MCGPFGLGVVKASTKNDGEPARFGVLNGGDTGPGA